jgi:hypothetical protein
MIIDNKILPGEELFKYLNYMIQQKNKKDDNGINNDLMPPKNNMEGQKNMGPMHNGNPMNLNMSSSQKNLNVPGNVNNDVQNIMSKMDTNENTMMPNKSNDNEDDLLPGFCIGGVCELGFSNIENDKDISMDNSFELLDNSGEISPEMDMGDTKSEKAKQVDDDYSRMMQERGNDLSARLN